MNRRSFRTALDAPEIWDCSRTVGAFLRTPPRTTSPENNCWENRVVSYRVASRKNIRSSGTLRLTTVGEGGENQRLQPDLHV